MIVSNHEYSKRKSASIRYKVSCECLEKSHFSASMTPIHEPATQNFACSTYLPRPNLYGNFAKRRRESSPGHRLGSPYNDGTVGKVLSIKYRYAPEAEFPCEQFKHQSFRLFALQNFTASDPDTEEEDAISSPTITSPHS